MFIYLVKVIACSGIFYSLYALLFNKEKMLVFNRFYLLGSLIASFLIPLITITVEVPVISQQPLYTINDDLVHIQSAREQGVDLMTYINNSLIAVTILISCYLLVRFLSNLSKLVAREKSNTSFYINRIKVVLLPEPVAPHSFLSTIYLSRSEYERGQIEAEVMEHEMAHIRQRHSWDILFIELLEVFTWYNPFIYWYKRSIKINHELLADAAVVKQLGDVRSYQLVLLQRAAAQSSLVLASSFTFYITQKRLTMLLKKSDKKRMMLMSLSLIPVIALVVLVGCDTVEKKETSLTPDEQKKLAKIKEDALSTVSKDTTISLAMPEVNPNADDSGIAAGLTEPKVDLKKFSPPKVIKDMPEGAGASANELITYEEVVKQMQSGGKNKYQWIEGKSDKLLPIYKKMTLTQRQEASPLPPPPPPKIEVKKFAPPQIVEDKETTRQNTPGEGNKTISVLYDSGPGKGATNQELREYIQLVDQMKAAIGNNDNRTITSMWNEYSKAHWIYSAMDKEQRAKYAKGFNELAMLSNKKAQAIRHSGLIPNE